MVMVEEVLFLIVLLFLSGFFSGAEVALVSLSRVKLRRMIENNSPGSKYVHLLKENQQRMLSTILLGNNLVNVLAAAYTTSIALNLFGDLAVGIATGVMTFLILVFGEITPKSIAVNNNEVTSRMVAPVIWYLSIIFSPILSSIEWMINALPRLLGIKTQAKVMTHEDLLQYIKIAEEEGAIKDAEEEFISNILKFDDKKIKEVMTVRRKLIMVKSDDRIRDVRKTISKTGFSRLPVYDAKRDEFTGILYAKSILEYLDRPGARIDKLVLAPMFVPETLKLSHVFRKFKEVKQQMALVVDERGTVTGLVTLEDVIEEIVGDIHDENEEQVENIRRLNEYTWAIKGDTPIDEINAYFRLNLNRDGFNTLSGFIMARLSKIPKAGDEVALEHYLIRVKETKKHAVLTATIERT